MTTATRITTGLLAAGALTYLAYFDYQRRHSPQFRRHLRQLNADHAVSKERAQKLLERKKWEDLEVRIDHSLQHSPLPSDIKDRQQFFLAEIAQADQHVVNGQNFDAALAFYRALAAHTNPLELLGLYEKSVQPQEVMDLIRSMIVIRPPPVIAKLAKDGVE